MIPSAMKKLHLIGLIGLIGLIAVVASLTINALATMEKPKTITVHAAGRGNPWVNLRDGRDLPAAYARATGSQQLLQQELTRPTALAAGDFDEDGVPDLVSGYVGPGGGTLTLHGGNIDSLFPNHPGAQQRKADGAFIDAPFLSPARVFEIPEAPDFLGTGDFDADGHWDVVAAARGSDHLYWLPGDGRGGLGVAEWVELPGVVSALLVGEINRRDGLTDVIVGISGPDGPEVLVFEWPAGALQGEPEAFPLPAEATAVVLGQLDGHYAMDLAVGAGSELVIIHGRDRRLSLDEIRQAEEQPAGIDQVSFPFAIASMALGDFIWDRQGRAELALLSEDGTLHVATRGELDTRPTSMKEILANRDAGRGLLMDTGAPGDRDTETPGRADASASQQTETWELSDNSPLPHFPTVPLSHSPPRLVKARVSSLPLDDLVVVDPNNHQLHILLSDASPVDQYMEALAGEKRVGSYPLGPSRVGLDVEGAPVAVLPMRLNGDALSDLVILKEESSGPTVALTVAMATITVNSAELTSVPGDGECTLLEALGNADGNGEFTMGDCAAGSGMDTIEFSISQVPTIEIGGSLAITDAVVIDGTTQPGFMGTPIVELQGSGVPNGSSGLFIRADDVVVRGLVINNFNTFASNGIHLRSPGFMPITNNVIEGNFIGTDVSGVIDASNWVGVFLQGASGNTIGGTTPEARNVISGNVNDGILFNPDEQLGNSTTNNRVQGNYIGPGVNGIAPLSNGGAGVAVIGRGLDFPNASNNIIGGTEPGARNIISSNGPDLGVGVLIRDDGTTGTLVQGNYIGTNADGTAARGNQRSGVFFECLFGCPTDITIGGMTSTPGAAPGNLISGNLTDGIHIAGADTTVTVQGNVIGLGSDNTKVPNISNGVFVDATPDIMIGGTLAGARNVISGNGDNGVLISGANGTQVQGNYIGTDVNGSQDRSNGVRGVFILNASDNRIGGHTVLPGAPPGNVISGHGSTIDMSGIEIRGSGSTMNRVEGNLIGTNAAGDAPLGNARGVRVAEDASGTIIGGPVNTARNVISGNGSTGVRIDRGPMTQVKGNYIGTNRTGDDALGNFIGVSITGTSGITIGGTTTTPGGPCAGDCNLISGNQFEGISIIADGNRVEGNFIGTNAQGDASLGDTSFGVSIFGGDNTIGGTMEGARNVVSGHETGVSIFGNMNRVQGNYIGTNAQGDAPLPNEDGVVIGENSQNNTIGGPTSMAGTSPGNVISGNENFGVVIFGNTNMVQGNLIGTKANGIEPLPNKAVGVSIENASDNMIGGELVDAQNVISGNGGGSFRVSGILIRGEEATGNRVAINLIGTDRVGINDLGNQGDGVLLDDDTANNMIDFNTIAFNRGKGITLTNEAGIGTIITHNFISSNVALGIDQNDDGVTTNDVPEGDSVQNYPFLFFAVINDSGGITIFGAVTSTPNTGVTLEFFANGACDPSGFGEGQRFIGSVQEMTDGNGETQFVVAIPQITPILPGQFITATATDEENNTSEFSPCVQVTATVPTDSDGDGTPDSEENDAPNGGDGNGDGIPDSQQDNVVSFLSANGQYVILVVPPGPSPIKSSSFHPGEEAGLASDTSGLQAQQNNPNISLANVQALADPAPGTPPPTPNGLADFPVGFFGFDVLGLAPGGTTTVEMLLPPDVMVNSYYKFGTTPDNPLVDHWYEFLFDGTTGAEFLPDRVILHFVDGQRGDADLTVNAAVVEPGGPASVIGCGLTPSTATNPVGTDHTVTVTVEAGGVGTPVNFTVTSGPNAGASGTGTTDASGQANFTYTGDGGVGIDTIEASGTVSGVPFSCTASKDWEGISSTLLPTTATNPVGTDHVVTVTTESAGAPQSGVAVDFAVTAGPNAGTMGIGTTDATGQTSFTYTGSGGAGTDTIEANGTVGGAPFTSTASKTWAAPTCSLSPPTAANPVGTDHTVTVTAEAGGMPQSGVAVDFNMTSGPNAGASGMGTTNASGQASFTYTSNGTVGTDMIEGSGSIAGVSFSCTATKEWIDASCVLEPPTATNFVGTDHTVTLNLTDSGAPAVAVLASFIVTQGPNEGASGGDTTDADGQANFTYTGGAFPGIDTIEVSGTVGGVPYSCTATKTWMLVPIGDFVVNSTGDSGDSDPSDDVCDDGTGNCTLRAAIEQANATQGLDTIIFDIPGGGVPTIRPQSALPTLFVGGGAVIDATTQPGSGLVELDGSVAGAGANGLKIQDAQVTVRGLVINRFPGHGIFIEFAGSHIIEGNFIGTNPTGTIDLGNGGDGIHSAFSEGNIIGGATSAARNIISGNDGNGITIIFGGELPNRVEGNYIGTGDDGLSPLGNGLHGVLIRSIATATAFRNVIEGNTIAHNGQEGVLAAGSASGILANAIFSNTDLGINLCTDFDSAINVCDEAVTPNDPGDEDAGPNTLQNFPVLTSATASGGNTTIMGELDTQAGTYALQFFANTSCDLSGFGEGQTFLGELLFDHAGSGAEPFTATGLAALPPGPFFITATATNLAVNATSELSQCMETMATGQADVTLTKNGPQSINCTEAISYTLHASNIGDAAATGVMVTDDLPACLTDITCAATQGSCTVTGAAVTVNIGTLDPGATAETTIMATVDPACAPSLSNLATITADADANPGNNSSTADTSVNCAVACSLEPATPTSSPVGTDHTVTETVTINGALEAGVLVNFEVTAGPNAGTMGVATTEATGQASFTYAGTGGVGTDVIEASGAVAGTPFSCTAQKEWVGNQPPVAVCQDVTVSARPNCTAFTTINGGSFDPDGDPITITQDPPGPFPLGTTTATLTVADDNGDQAMCQAPVTVVDDTPPSKPLCRDITVALDVNDRATISPDDVFTALSSTDNCGTVTAVSVTPDSFSLADVGQNTVTLTVADGSGNQATCEATVTVVDETPSGGQGCTPGYWKQTHHFDSWPAPFTPDTLFSDIFEDAFPGMTLLDILKLGRGGLNALGRHTVAALLNAASSDVSYDLSVNEVIDKFNTAFPGSKKDFNGLKTLFEDLNEQGCPLS